jgi:sugar/nucleoside kinase (ribokinase family)
MSIAPPNKRFDITLVGEANIDLLLYGLPEDLPPERELLADRMAMLLGGSPAITAHNLAALGSRVGFITAFANDAFAQICRRELESAGVDISRAIEVGDDARTGFTVLLQHDHLRRTLTYPGATYSIRFSDLDLEYLASARHFHLSSYFLQKDLRADVPRLFAELKAAGLSVSLDTNDDPSGLWDESIYEILGFVDILMPNKSEACHLAHESQFDLAVRKLSSIVPIVVVKQGAEGAVAFTESSTYSASAYTVTAIDAVGAGDSFNAGFLHAWLHGESIEQCLAMGNLVGAYSTTAAGGVSAFRNVEGMRKFMKAGSNATVARCTGHR